jgi:hypothetical protein
LNTAFYYRLDGIILRSNLPLPELIAANSNDDSDYDFYLSAPMIQPDYDISCNVKVREGLYLLKLGKQAADFILRFNEIADFRISEASQEIQCNPSRDIDVNVLRHLLLDYVLPCVLNLHGKIVLHASAVATDKGAVAFIAPSGTGKSSLVSVFCQHGIALLADDRVVVEKQSENFSLIPAYPGLRLWSPMVEVLWQQPQEIVSTNHRDSIYESSPTQAASSSTGSWSPIL